MKSVTTALICLASTASSCAFAQTTASSFEGLSAGLSLGFNNVAVAVSDPGGIKLADVSSADQNFVFQMAKGIAFGSNGVVNFGVSAVLGDTKAGSVGALQIKASSNYSVYGELGYALDTRSLAYAKLSYNRLTGELSGGGPGVDASLASNGTGVGIGYRRILAQGIYLQGEWMQVDFEQVGTGSGLQFKPSSNVAMVGVGYKF